jgi:hypothetical protein
MRDGSTSPSATSSPLRPNDAPGARTALLVATAMLCFVSIGQAQQSERVPLNSERIAASFGSYGIEVLASDDDIRVSNLYSTDDGKRTTRTFAVVRFRAAPDGALASEYEAVLAGGSIGATFAASGWRVDKHNRLYTEIEATKAVAELMRFDPGAALAVHLYELEVERDGMRFPFAAIAEVHHPDYLGLDDLEAIYGPVPALDPQAQESMEALLELTRRRMAVPGGR